MASRRFLTRMVIAWLPVACLLGLAFVAASPGSSAIRISGSLSISPKEFYGGQAVTFSGSIGSGKHKIWLEYNMGHGWTRIEGSNKTTDASGHFKFQFPARGMNNIKLRVATQGAATPQVNFTAVDQAVSLTVRSQEALDSTTDCRPDLQLYKSYYAPTATPLDIHVDATPDGEPPLKGRTVTLQSRTGSGSWTSVATSKLDDHGEATFAVTASTTDEVVYRAVLGAIKNGVNRIGWFPSFPTYVDPQDRPHVATAVHTADPTPGSPNPADIDLTWNDGTASTIVAWNKGSTAPLTPDGADDVRVVTGGSPINLDDLVPDQQYAFSVFTRTGHGVCADPQSATGQTDPTPPVTNVHAPDVQWDYVGLAWDLPDIPPGIIDEIKVRRKDGATAPTDPAGPAVADYDFATDNTTDVSVAPSTTYSYSVFVKINGVWSVAASTTVTTGAPPP